MKQKAISRAVIKLSKGTFTTLTDILLYSFFLLGASIGKTSTSGGVAQTFQEATRSFTKFNSKTILEAISRMKTKYKYINLKKERDHLSVEITSLGRRKLSQMVPEYRTHRPWNGKLYLVSFDIPENKRKLRDSFRMILKKLSAGLLQKSIWLTPYNPIQVLKPMIEKFSMDEWVIITPITKNAILPYGERGLPALLEKLYNLSDLDKRYSDFIDNVKETDKLNLSFTYLNILKDDPQLPFELEPKDFHGKQAYQIYIANIRK